jgi:hypothetical protein
LAFDRPPLNDIDNHQRLAALYRLLNDYAAMKVARQPIGFGLGNFSGPDTSDLPTLVNALRSGDAEIESLERAFYKYRYVGLRTGLYGPNKIGFEIRSGWRKSWPNYKSLVQRLALTLQNLDRNIRIKRNPARDASEFTLIEHYIFHTSPNNQPSLQPRLFSQMQEEAIRVASARASSTLAFSTLPTHVALDNNETPDVEILRRWLMAFIPWEYHPSISKSPTRQAAIVRARNRLIVNLNFHLSYPPIQMPNADYVTSEIEAFFTTTQIFRYL